MRTIIPSFLLLVLSASFLYSQELPNYLTDKEKEILKTYVHPIPLDGSTNPPSFVPRTMAEWEELQGIMITWRSYTEILRQVVDYAQEEGIVYIVCSDSNSVKSYLTFNGIPLYNLKFLIEPSNSVWCRDYGPWHIYKDFVDSLSIVDWIYNRPRPQDDVLPQAIADFLNVPIYHTTQSPYNLNHTGGNFMTDGHGTGFSSKLVLDENPGKSEAEIDAIMNSFMGIDRFIKMENLPYDGIHHIDMHIKLLDEETLLVGEYPTGIADGPQIEANLQYILNNFQTCFGREYKVVRIPMPPDQFGRYPNTGGYYRTYTNSIIINGTVIVPTYAEQYDTTALRIYREAMPGYNIVVINSNDIIPAKGAIHCITKEIGVYDPVFISHAKVYGPIIGDNPIEISADIHTVSGIANASVFWTNDTSLGFNEISMSNSAGSIYTAFIPGQSQIGKVFYYVSASSNSGRTNTKPSVAPGGTFNFEVTGTVPVELLSFQAKQVKSKIYLNWVTATETNNYGFEIERKYNNEWQTVGFIKGQGTSTNTNEYAFIDEKRGESPNDKVLYRLKQIDFSGEFSYSKIIEIILAPKEFVLKQNYPNPFNPSTTIEYQIAELSDVSIKIYDVLGRDVLTLLNEEKEPGNYKITFNAFASSNWIALSSGVYYYRMKAGDFMDMKKFILIK